MKNTQVNIDTETLQLLPVAVMLYDNERIYFFNQKAIDLFQVPKKTITDFKTISAFDLILNPFQKILKSRIKQILSGKELPPLELECHNFSGEKLYIEVKSNCVYFQGKKVVQSTILQINDRVSKIKELEKAHSIIQKFNSNINDIIFEHSFIPHPHIAYISDSVYKILGRTAQEVYENPNVFLQSMHPDDQKNYVTSLQSYLKVTKKKTISKLVFRYNHPNGKLMYLESAGTPVIVKKQVVGIVGVIRDVTNEQFHNQAINQKWTNYKNLIEKSPIGIVIHQGICYYANKAAAIILEEDKPERLIGKYLGDYFLPEELEKAKTRVSNALNGSIQENLVYNLKTAKGNNKEVELKTMPFIFDGKECVQTIISDISAEKKLENEKLRLKLAESTNKVLVNVINARKAAEAKLDAVFNTSSHIIWTINTNYEITSFNKNYYNQLSEHYQQTIKNGVDLKKLYQSMLSKSDYKLWMSKYALAFKGDNILFETIKKISKTTFIHREIYLNPIFNEEGKIVEVAAISHDITSRKIQDEKIQQQAAKLKAIFESGNQLLWTVNREYVFTSFNQNFSDAMEKIYGIIPNTTELYFPSNTKKGLEYHQWWISKYNEVFETKKSVDFTTEQEEINKVKHYRQIFLHPIFNQSGKVDEISCTSNDITELKYLQHQASSQSARLKSIFESGNHSMWTINRKNEITSFNQNFAKEFYAIYKIQPVLNQTFNATIGRENNAVEQFWADKITQVFKGQKVEFIAESVNTKGERAYLQYYLYPIKNKENEIIEMSGLAFDITENKENEVKLKQSLKEKEVLLKEVHHRVKNNMQVISSILNLQSSYVKDEYALGLLKESQNRIKSMSFIHESLYQTKNFELVNFSDYLITLSKNLIHSYSVNTQKIKLELDLDTLFLNLDISIPCGLIINEIISNSLKYAFPNNREGVVFIKLKKKDKKIILEIGDNGIGIPKNVDVKNTETLGLQLVFTLIEQINATLTLIKQKGTTFKIEFNIN